MNSAFRNIAELVREHATARPEQPALVQGETVLTYGALDALMDRVAAALQRDGVQPGASIALCGATTPMQAALFLGALRAGVAVAPLAPSVTPDTFASMLSDAQATLLFVDTSAAALVPDAARRAASRSTPARPARPWRRGWRNPARYRPTWPSGPKRLSTSSIRRAPPARPRASCSRTACAGRM